MSDGAGEVVSEALVADLYMRVERLEVEVRRLARLTAHASLTAADDPPKSQALAETSRVAHPAARVAAADAGGWPGPQLALPPTSAADPELALARTALDVVADAVVALDGSGVVTLWNAAAVQLFGWTAAEVVGQLAPFVPEDRQGEHAEFCRDPRALRAGQELDTIRVNKLGDRLDVRLRCAPTEGGGIVQSLRPVPRDAVAVAPPPSPTHPDSRLVRHAAVGKLVAGVAHDFNNILAVLQGYGELLSEHLPPGGPLGDAAGSIVTAAGLGGSISRHLLSLASPEPLTPPATDVGLLLRQTDRFLKSLVGASVRVNTTAPAGLPSAKCHPSELFQVLLNLAANARDAMPAGGVLSVRASAAVIPVGRANWPEQVPTGEFIVLTVADTGHGMTPATLAKLATPGFTTRPEGHGLGLATVRAIVHRAEGHLEVESDPEWGTCLTVYLKRA